MMADFWIGYVAGAASAWLTLYFQHLTNKLFVKNLKKTLESHNEQSKKVADELIEKTAAVITAQSLENTGKLN